MGSAYDADRIFGTLTLVRACLGVLLAMVLLVLCAIVSTSSPAQATPPTATYQVSQGRPADLATEAFPHANETERSIGSSYVLRGYGSSGSAWGYALLALMAITFSANEWSIGRWIANGELQGFVCGVLMQGALGAFTAVGFFILWRSPILVVHFLLTLVTFAYCLARLNGTGPRPVVKRV